MTRLYVINDGYANGWTNSTRTCFTISVECNELTVSCVSGRDPFAYEINAAFAMFLNDYVTENGKIERYNRSNRYRFAYREGSSGCQDTYIEIDERKGFPTRKLLMHESCFGKCSGFRCFVYDFVDLCVASGFLGVEDGFYSVPEEAAEIDCNIKVVKPRYTEYEEGWTSPLDIPEKVVYLKCCREIPEEQPDDDTPDETRDEVLPDSVIE